jgi:hypothetical protein
MSTADAQLPTGLHQLVVEGVVWRRQRTRVVVLLLLGLGGVLTLMMIAEGGIVGLGVGAIAMLPGALLLRANSGDPSRDKVIRKLLARRESIVWIFADPNVNTRAARVVVGFDDRSSLQIEAVPGSDQFNSLLAQKQLVAELERFAPEATVGFSMELRAQFGRAPESLRRR